MAEEEGSWANSPHENIEAAYNALLSMEDIDMKLYGDKEMKSRITKNCLTIIDKSLVQIVEDLE